MITTLFILSIIALIVLFTMFINKKPITYEYEYFVFNIKDLVCKSQKRPEWLPNSANVIIKRCKKTVHMSEYNHVSYDYVVKLSPPDVTLDDDALEDLFA